MKIGDRVTAVRVTKGVQPYADIGKGPMTEADYGSVPSGTAGRVEEVRHGRSHVVWDSHLIGWYDNDALAPMKQEWSVAGSRHYVKKGGWSGNEQYPTLKVHADSEKEAVRIAKKAYAGNGLKVTGAVLYAVLLGTAEGRPVENVHGETYPHPKSDPRHMGQKKLPSSLVEELYRIIEGRGANPVHYLVSEYNSGRYVDAEMVRAARNHLMKMSVDKEIPIAQRSHINGLIYKLERHYAGPRIFP